MQKIETSCQIATMECPICKGRGELEPPKKRDINTKAVVRILYNNGYTYRQLCKIFNYKTPRSIQLLVKPKKNEKAA